MKNCFEEALKYDEDSLGVAGFYTYSKLFVADWNNLEHYKNLTLLILLNFIIFSISYAQDFISIKSKSNLR